MITVLPKSITFADSSLRIFSKVQRVPIFKRTESTVADKRQIVAGVGLRAGKSLNSPEIPRDARRDKVF